MKKILVADDEKALRILIAGTLEIGSFEVIEADNGIDAIKIAEREKPDLAIIDVMMPGMTGYEVCEHIKTTEKLRNIKVVILTAKGQQSDREAAQNAQADYYISKPFSPAELLSAVESILEAK